LDPTRPTFGLHWDDGISVIAVNPPREGMVPKGGHDLLSSRGPKSERWGISIEVENGVYKCSFSVFDLSLRFAWPLRYRNACFQSSSAQDSAGLKFMDSYRKLNVGVCGKILFTPYTELSSRKSGLKPYSTSSLDHQPCPFPKTIDLYEQERVIHSSSILLSSTTKTVLQVRW